MAHQHIVACEQIVTIGGCLGVPSRRENITTSASHHQHEQMDDDFIDALRGGVGDSPAKTSSSACAVLPPSSSSDHHQHHFGHSSSPRSHWPGQRAISLSIPAFGMEAGGGGGGAAATMSPAIPSHGIAMPSPAKESVLRSARLVLDGTREDEPLLQTQLSPVPSPHPRFGMTAALTIDPGGECVPTELEKKRAKLERFRYVCSEVSENFLYVAGEDAAKQEGLVREVGVTHIINCAGPQCPNYLEYTGRFDFLRLNFYDHRTEDVAWFIYSAFDFISAAKAKKGRVLIHCVQGVSRSCTLAIAWLMLTTTMDYDEAYLRVRHGRPICAPNTGFICSLLEWQRRREQLPTAPLLYRTAFHVPNFPMDVVLKICLHEEDRKHLAPTLQALDPRGCYLLVAPPRPASSTQSDESLGSGLLRLPGAGVSPASPLSASSKSPPPPRAENDDRGRVEDYDDDTLAAGAFEFGVARANGGGIATGTDTGRSNVPLLACTSSSSTIATPATAAAIPTATTPAIGPVMEHVGNSTASVAPTAGAGRAVSGLRAGPEATSSRAGGAVAAAGEAARTAKALEAGVAIAAAFRDTAAACVREAAKIAVGAGAGVAVKEASAAEAGEMAMDTGEDWDEEAGGGEGLRSVPMAVEEQGVEVYVWRGSESNPQMLELARRAARWLREYEGWGEGENAPVVKQGQEPPEMLRHLGLPGSDVREPPIYGDLTAPTPPPTALRAAGGGSMFHQTHPSGYPCSVSTPRTAALPSPAELPSLSPAGPSPSPGGVSFSPYGHGVSPASGIMMGIGGGGGSSDHRSSGGGGGAYSYGGMLGSNNSGSIICPMISPAGSTVVSPATPRLQIMSEMAPLSRRCSAGSATEEGDEDRSYMLMGLSAMGAAVEGEGEAGGEERVLRLEEEGGGGTGRNGGRSNGVVVLVDGGVEEGKPGGGQRMMRQERRTPRLFELAEEEEDVGVGIGASGGGGVGGAGSKGAAKGGLRWSELMIFDDQDLVPQCCFLLVPSDGQSFLWVGEEFAAAHTQEPDGMRQVQSLARNAAVRDANKGLLGVSDVDQAVPVAGDGSEPEEWWNAFESSYA